ncbi:MAG TPA: hypothetical protein VFA11_19185 [Acidimicrobiales bacterium]|nr:hypothetical protein [Acidimicrobiales bacterium]
MNYLVWRQHRNQVLFATVALVALAVLLLVTGAHMGAEYRAAVASGLPSGELFRGDGVLFDIVVLTGAVPVLLGLFWGAPIVAREIEAGTHLLAWTQGVTRRRWLGSQIGWTILAAAVWGGAISALVTWWNGALHQVRFEPQHFDVSGLAPVAYSMFAVALGIAAGALIRRVMPTLAVTVAGFVGLRIVVENYLRPHFMGAITRTVPLGFDTVTPSPGDWVVSSGVIDPTGHVSDGIRISLDTMPTACRAFLPGGPSKGDSMLSCLGAHGYRSVFSYQPAGRYWAFQGMEAAIFIALAGLLVLLAFRLVGRRDA